MLFIFTTKEINARAWCEMKGYKYIGYGAWDVFYVTPEQEGKKMQGLSGEIDAYSSVNWMKVLEEME